MRHTVYKTTNTANGKVYIGVHETENPDDSYMGSGMILRRALRKYGKQAFVKEVLHEFDSREEMFSKERELVTPAFCNREDNYNLIPGGEGGWYVVNQGLMDRSPEWRQRKAAAASARHLTLLDEDPEYARRFRERCRKQSRQAHREGKVPPPPGFAGRTHTEETKAKIGVAARRSSCGAANSQYGTVWVCRNGERPQKVKRESLETLLKKGWVRGRKVR